MKSEEILNNIKSFPKLIMTHDIKLPYIKTIHSGRVYTKHYTNLLHRLSPAEISLFNFFIHESTGYNCFRYTTLLLRKYRAYLKVVEKTYKIELDYPISLDYLRATFRKMINDQLIFKTDESKYYFINPAYTYRPKWFIESDYKKWWNGYESAADLNELHQVNQQSINKIKEVQKIYKK